MKNKKLNLTALSFLIIFLFSYNGTNFTLSKIEVATNQPILNADPLIVIDDDSDFSIYPGYGNETHPYIIEGFEFEAPTEDDIAINITGTTAYFLIRNNEFRAEGFGRGLYGIYLKDIAPNTARIENNEMRAYYRIVFADNAPGITIKDNTCYKLKVTGYFLLNCPFATIENNFLYCDIIPSKMGLESSNPSIKAGETDMYSALYCHNCSDLIFNENDVNLDGMIAGSGINVEYSDRIAIENNIIKNQKIDIVEYEIYEKAGLWFEYINNGTIFNNTLEYTEKSSLIARACDNLVISNNTFGETQTFGLSFVTTSNCNITYNSIQDHPSYAIDLSEGSNNNTIHHNEIKNNRLNSQARDSGTGNIWYDTTTDEGNWWIGDWYGGDYTIDGIAGSVDPFPLGEPLVIPEFSTTIISLILLISASIAIIPIIRRKRN